MIIINTPQNPTGYVATQEDVEAIATLAKKYDLLVLCDESYDRFIYDDKKHISFASLPDVAGKAATLGPNCPSNLLSLPKTSSISNDKGLRQVIFPAQSARIPILLNCRCDYFTLFGS